MVWQTNASSDILKNENKNNSKMEQMKKWLHLGSGFHTGLHLGSGMKMRSGEKMWSKEKEHMDDGDRKHYGSGNKSRSGEKEHIGSGKKLGTGINKNMDKKTKKLDSVFKKMTDEKLTSLLTQINTLTTTITDPTLLSIINNIKALIQQNIGN